MSQPNVLKRSRHLMKRKIHPTADKRNVALSRESRKCGFLMKVLCVWFIFWAMRTDRGCCCCFGTFTARRAAPLDFSLTTWTPWQPALLQSGLLLSDLMGWLISRSSLVVGEKRRRNLRISELLHAQFTALGTQTQPWDTQVITLCLRVIIPDPASSSWRLNSA